MKKIGARAWVTIKDRKQDREYEWLLKIYRKQEQEPNGESEDIVTIARTHQDLYLFTGVVHIEWDQGDLKYLY